MYYYNARWYDPQLGRFAQADTIVPEGVQGLDRYAYVNNNPVNFNDPSGHMWVNPDGHAGNGEYAKTTLDKAVFIAEKLGIEEPKSVNPKYKKYVDALYTSFRNVNVIDHGNVVQIKPEIYGKAIGIVVTQVFLIAPAEYSLSQAAISVAKFGPAWMEIPIIIAEGALIDFSISLSLNLVKSVAMNENVGFEWTIMPGIINLLPPSQQEFFREVVPGITHK